MKLIDIDPLKEQIDKEVKEGKVLGGWAFFFKAYLDDAPIIDIDRPKGEWIDKGWRGDWQFETDGRGNCWHEYECSECGFHSKGSKSNFCSNCGADMRKREGK